MKTPSKAKSIAAANSGPLTLAEARALAVPAAPASKSKSKSKAKGAKAIAPAADALGAERKRRSLARRAEQKRRIKDYTATMKLLKKRGVAPLAGAKKGLAKGGTSQPLQIFAEGDSWFDYPVPIPFFGGGVIPRLEDRLGVPILNLAKAGDEVRFMLGVEERKVLTEQFKRGSPAGGQWDVMLFSGGGNDIVDNPMALWIRDFDSNATPAALIHAARFQAALDLVRAAYEDLISMRDKLSPNTHLFFHGYDFVIPDGRGICHLGPWLKPAFDTRGFPAGNAAFLVVKEMLTQFAAMVRSFTARPRVSFINTQGTLKVHKDSWHNEMHPSKNGFNQIAAVFQAALKSQFPTRLP